MKQALIICLKIAAIPLLFVALIFCMIVEFAIDMFDEVWG
jgi:hypothetical protein